MNTEDKTLYIQIPCSEELPEYDDYQFVIDNQGFKTVNCLPFNKVVDYWLKPVSESKFACDFADWLNSNYYPTHVKGMYYNILEPSVLKTTSKLQQEFLKTYKS